MQEAGRWGFAVRWRARLPGGCEVCGTWTQAGLCGPCGTRFAPRVDRCRRCALPLPEGLQTCTECLQEPPAFERSLCVADYGFPWQRLIARFKYGRTPELAALLATALLAAAARDDAPPPEAFVALPLSPRRLAERGYDQAWELARALGREAGLPAHARVLERRFDAPAQARSSRAQRMRNLQGAFAVAAGERLRVEGRHLALVDDVMTTGASAREAARVLREAGAARVDLWIVARTPAPAPAAAPA
ncbi:MAG: competence protein F [Rubrivivax sp.]|jgi:ComF family protein